MADFVATTGSTDASSTAVHSRESTHSSQQRQAGTGTVEAMAKRSFSTYSQVNVLGMNSSGAVKYGMYTIKELQDKIDERGISRKGMKVKSDLIGVLQAHDADPTESNPYKKPDVPKAPKKVRSDTTVKSSVVAAKKGGLVGISDEGNDYSNHTVPQLKKVIDDRGISRRGMGVKSDLIGVLQSHDEDPTGQNPYKKPYPSNELQKLKKAAKAKPPPYVQPENIDAVDHNSMATGEKRVRPYQAFPDRETADKIWKARNEKQYVFSRTNGLEEGLPTEIFQILGSKGGKGESKRYTVVFNKSPKCDCVSASFRNTQKCKHVLYIKMHVFKITGTLLYQLAYLSTELHQIFANAPPAQLPLISHNPIEDEKIYNGKHKAAEGDCPVCYMEVEEGNHDLVWCKGSCGKNVHSECINILKDSYGVQAKCPHCRASWIEGDADDEVEPCMKAEFDIEAGSDMVYESEMMSEDKENISWDWDEELI